jgi:hypothetical protein
MDLITDPTADATDPGVPSLTGTRGYFTGGTPGITAATRVRYWFLNMVMKELLYLLTQAGITPDPTNATQVFQAIQKLCLVKLTGNLNVYVTATGNDSTGNGTSGAPFATLQRAYDYLVTSVHMNGFAAVIDIGAGTFAAVVCVSSPVGMTEASAITFQGLGSTTIISSVTNACFGAANCAITIAGLELTAGGSSGPYNSTGMCVAASIGGTITIAAGVIFGTASNDHMQAYAGGVIETNGVPYTIVGSAQAHLTSGAGGVINTVNSTVTLVGTPAFSVAFAETEPGGVLNAWNMIFSGSATGPKFNNAYAALINTSGGGINYFPGNAAGSNAGEYV